ncbi:lipoprotein, partial [uncultured Halomonas sp.]|uniref:lipoprotein n=1 Tax=uncultured Halomonas sp. TaxID=173971 RepID=UPI002627DFC9
MKRMIYAVLAALALAGCASVQSPMDDGYQFGDLASTVLSLQAEYCATADPRERAFRLAALRAAGVPIPPSGACFDILALVPEAELDVDVEQSERDRERFEGMSDAGTDSPSA